MPKRIKEAYAFLKSKEERSKIEGINAEYELVSLLNKNRNNHNPLWVGLKNRLNLPANDIYAIRVSRQVHSNFLEQTIYPKSDLYLCKARIDENKLDEFGYVLDEDIIKKDKIFIEPINDSGISCKIPSSNKFTYAKISVNSFIKIFHNYSNARFYGAGASIFVKGDDISLNNNVLSGWGVTISDFVMFLNKELSLTYNTISELSHKDWNQIKSFCNKKIEEIIKNDKQIQDMIFIGKGLFDNPYYAPIIFSKGKLKDNKMPTSFIITTGSGRHKGVYTIIVKPK